MSIFEAFFELKLDFLRKREYFICYLFRRLHSTAGVPSGEAGGHGPDPHGTGRIPGLPKWRNGRRTRLKIWRQ